jgi:Mini-chromosome maintenance replisome factor
MHQNCGVDLPAIEPLGFQSNSSLNLKRRRDEQLTSEIEKRRTLENGQSMNVESTVEDTSSGLYKSVRESLPFPGCESDLPCLVRIYGCENSDLPLRLGDMVEFIGILTVDSDEGIKHDTENGDAIDKDEDIGFANTPKLPVSLVPRLQCIVMRMLAPTYPLYQPPTNLSFVTDAQTSGASATESVSTYPFSICNVNKAILLNSQNFDASLNVMQHALSQSNETRKNALSSGVQIVLSSLVPSINVIRSSILKYLGECLGNDDLVAEYVLLHLLSSITLRDVVPTPVGKLSINIQGFPDISENNKPAGVKLVGSASPAATRLSSALHTLLPRESLVPLSLQALDTLRFAPKKNADSDRLFAGTFQCASGTHITLDATVMSTGTLSSPGVVNLRELQSAINDQTLTLTFPFHTQRMPIDLQFLLVSTGRPLLAVDLVVLLTLESRLKIAKDAHEPIPIFSEDLVQAARIYLSLARHLPFKIPSDVRDKVEKDLSSIRGTDRSFGQPEMHKILSLARFLALSYGETELTLSRWEEVKALETERKSRESS